MTNETATYESSHPVSEKRRVYISPLGQYGSDLILARDPHKNHLDVYRRSEFEKRINALNEKCSKGRQYLPALAPRAIRRLNRFLCGKSVEFNPDSQGSATISKSLSQDIGMPTSVIIKEVYEKDKILEIWNAEEYNFS
jgi:DNA-binding transcriptional regulator/RsmH inhibitor MraZ